MSAKSKEQLAEEVGEGLTDERAEGLAEELAEDTDRREVYLRAGRSLTIEPTTGGELVEIRSPSGQVELRVKLTEDGPVLQLDSVRLQLKATEDVEIEGKRVAIKARETITVASEDEVQIEGQGDVRVRGDKIYLN